VINTTGAGRSGPLPDGKHIMILPLRFLSFVSLGLFALTLQRLSASRELAKTVLLQTGYGLTLLLTLVCAYGLFPWAMKFIAKRKRAAVACALLTALTFLAAPPAYRVLSDETNLLSVSQSMHRERSIWNVTEARTYQGNLLALQAGIPTRPLLFPFLTSLLHSVSGYRYQNVFVLNFLLLTSLLLLLWIPLEERSGKTVALSGVLLLLSIPTLILSASSGGFDLCALLFLALSLLLFLKLLHHPEPEVGAAFLPALLLLSQVRYESILYSGTLLLATLVAGRGKFIRSHSSPFLFPLLPWLFLPMILQRFLLRNSFENPPGVPPFALQHLLDHGKILVDTLLHPRPEHPYPALLNQGALLLLPFLVLFKGGKETRVPRLFLAMLLFLPALNLLVILSHHFGVFPHPTQARLFLPFLCALALVPLIAHLRHPTLIGRRTLISLALVSFVVYLPVASEARFTRSLNSIRETSALYRFLASRSEDGRSLIVSSHPGQYIVTGLGAYSFQSASHHSKSLLRDLARGLLSRIYVFQKHAYATGRPISGEELPPEWKPEPIEDLALTQDQFVRISKVERKERLSP
jgi:hypothetical protein